MPSKIESAIAEALANCPNDEMAFSHATAFLDRLDTDPAWTKNEVAKVGTGLYREIVFRFMANVGK